MKKIYISPETEFVKCIPCAMIAASLPTDQGGPYTEDEFEGAATGEARNDWENIWGN